MRRVTRRLSHGGRTAGAAPGRAAADRLVLPFELRQRSRLRATTQSGIEVGLFLDRGGVLRGGDLLATEDGLVIEVVAAEEQCSTVPSGDALALARMAYHLGNRHVMLQIGDGFLRYLHDHVLDQMVASMGLSVVVERVPFEPEPGAYPTARAGAHTHTHDPHGGSS